MVGVAQTTLSPRSIPVNPRNPKMHRPEKCAPFTIGAPGTSPTSAITVTANDGARGSREHTAGTVVMNESTFSPGFRLSALDIGFVIAALLATVGLLPGVHSGLGYRVEVLFVGFQNGFSTRSPQEHRGRSQVVLSPDDAEINRDAVVILRMVPGICEIVAEVDVLLAGLAVPDARLLRVADHSDARSQAERRRPSLRSSAARRPKRMKKRGW
jgi:hypothetical protein